MEKNSDGIKVYIADYVGVCNDISDLNKQQLKFFTTFSVVNQNKCIDCLSSIK